MSAEEDKDSLIGKRFVSMHEYEDVDQSFFDNLSGEWTEVSTPTEPKSWEPIQKEGAVLLLQMGQGKFVKYVFENGRYNLVGEVDG